MALEQISAWVMLAALCAYCLLGGADFGAGLWDLLAKGPRKERQRELLARAIGPIWEANHVWLILVIVMLFTCFPRAFAAVMTALHVPVLLMLVGVVLRGSSFVFRTYTHGGARAQARWGLVFSIASVATPVLLGVVLGAAASGRLNWKPASEAENAGAFDRSVYVSGFFEPWLAPFPFAVGLFALSLFAFLAAVYLCVEAEEPDLREDFRRRALVAGAGVGGMAAATWALAYSGAPLVSEGLTKHWWAIPLQIATGLAAVGALGALAARRYVAARALAVAQVTFILLGYGAATFPYLVVPHFTIQNSAAPGRTHALVLGALVVGTALLAPSLYVLFRAFKGRRAFAVLDSDRESPGTGLSE